MTAQATIEQLHSEIDKLSEGTFALWAFEEVMNKYLKAISQVEEGEEFQKGYGAGYNDCSRDMCDRFGNPDR